MRPGPRNLITDIAGLRVGNASDDALKSGTTVLLCDAPTVCSVDVRGGAPGTRETDLLAPHRTVGGVDAIVLSGGSGFGLDAASGVADALRLRGRGFAVGEALVPIVPAAILFDLLNGGDKDWGALSPYRTLGQQALDAAAADFAIGTVGAGTGATTADLKGGLGSASAVLEDGHTVGALVAVNALGSVLFGEGPHFRAAAFERDSEFGGRGLPAPLPAGADALRIKSVAAPEAPTATTIAIVATEATLTKAEAKQMAATAHDGIARAIWPAHTPFDGDLVFALATGRRANADPIALGAAAAAVLSRAIARAVYSAAAAPGDIVPAYRERFPD